MLKLRKHRRSRLSKTQKIFIWTRKLSDYKNPWLTKYTENKKYTNRVLLDHDDGLRRVAQVLHTAEVRLIRGVTVEKKDIDLSQYEKPSGPI